MSDTPDTRNHELTIELRDVVRGYRVGGQSVRALDEISLRLTGGQFVSVVGPSGAGKSTLLHLLGALDSPDSGSITFDGEEIDSLTDEQQSEFRHHRVGFIFQCFNLLPTLSAWENVAVPKLLDGVRYWARSNQMLFGSWIESGWATAPNTDPRSCPAARCSASRSRAHW